MLRSLRRFALVAAFLLVLAPVAQAEAPMVQAQVPGYYHLQLGEFEITALFDGVIQLDTGILRNTKSVNLQRSLSRMFVGNPKMQTAVNAYLINTGSHLVLVDTGTAQLFGPSLGHILQNLRTSGYTPEQVDTVLITHLHPDHVAGLCDAKGQAVFPNATVWAAQAEGDHWLSPEIASRAPAEVQKYFKLAVDNTAPYRAAGKWKTFVPGSVLVPGITAVNAAGHTPGHTAYEVESQGQKLLIWGDLMHAHAVQFANPGVSVTFDVDQKQAVAARLRIMKSVARTKTLVAGMHLPFPGIGHVREDGTHSYSWIPVEFSPLTSPAKPQ